MAFNPSKEVAIARDAADKLSARQVIVLYITADGTQFSYASYGRTKQLCDEARGLADVAYDAVMDALKEDAIG